jgi:hypothetical protein
MEKERPSPDWNIVKSEFDTLRQEILKRVELRNNLLFGTLTASGAILTFGLKGPLAPGPFVLILITSMLSILWAHNEVRVREISNYIRDNIESKFPDLGFLSYLKRAGQSMSIGGVPFQILSGTAIFLLTTLMAILAVFAAVENPPRWYMIGVAALGLASFATTFVLGHYVNGYWTK